MRIPVLLLAASLATASAKPHNVVFFIADDLGWKDLGCYGSSFYETPNLDRLAASGVRFTNAYAACPVCSPTRASILTGKYPQRTGITDYIGAAQPAKWNRPTKLRPAPYSEELALKETTVAETLKANGYATFFGGKWHLGGEKFWPEHQGFDVNMGGIDRGGPYGGDKYFSPYGNPRLPDGPKGEHLPDRLASEAAKFIADHQGEPFLVYLSFYSVHTPLMARPDLEKKYTAKRRTLKPVEPAWGQEGERKVRLVQDHAVYAGMVEAMDAAVGKVLDQLDALGLADNTLVIFTSDNGGLSTSEGHPTSNLPLRGGKGWPYEGGIRGPLLLRWPGVTQAGAVSDAVVTSPDFYPTLLEASNIPAPPNLRSDGLSLVPVLRGGAEADAFAARPVFWHYPHYGNQGGAPGGAVREGDWKFIEWYEGGPLELYNLKDDPSEAHNLADENPEQRDTLAKLLSAWREEVGAQMPTAR